MFSVWYLFHKLVNVLGFSGALVASNLMDKQGRKNLLIGSYLGMVCSISSVQLFRKFYTCQYHYPDIQTCNVCVVLMQILPCS
jgi:hypothetical protein